MQVIPLILTLIMGTVIELYVFTFIYYKISLMQRTREVINDSIASNPYLTKL